MEKERQVSDKRDPFDIFGGFTTPFSATNSFNDPFLARSSGSIPKGPVIHELDSDDEIEEDDASIVDKNNNGSARINKEPFVDHPDDDIEKNGHKASHWRIDFNNAVRFHSCKVTYGGIDGAYYTSSTTRRIGDDGVVMEECKEADKTTGEAKHRISKGVHDKGHSLTRKLNSDGKVETQQTLHNLNEDEIESFEKSWRASAGRYFPMRGSKSSTKHTREGVGGAELFDWKGLVALGSEAANRAESKKVVRINID